jgi:hypothetical protein
MPYAVKTWFQSFAFQMSLLYRCTEARTLRSKAAAAEERVLTFTYDARTVPALRSVYGHLRESLDALEARHADVARRLERYDAAASVPASSSTSSSAAGAAAVDFEALAREYAELDVELKHREWTLRLIKKDVDVVKF